MTANCSLTYFPDGASSCHHRQRVTTMAEGDGLWRVTTPYLCGGYVVRDGEVVKCAPILRKRLNYWRTIAVLVTADVNESDPSA